MSKKQEVILEVVQKIPTDKLIKMLGNYIQAGTSYALENIFKNSKEEDDNYLTLTIKYYDSPCGRLSQSPYSNLGTLERNVRGNLCKDLYYDIDIVNSMPTIIYNRMKQAGFECKELGEYVHRRNDVIQKITDDSGISKTEIKELISGIINFKSITEDMHETIKNMALSYRKCMNKYIKHITGQNGFKPIYENEKMHKPKTASYIYRLEETRIMKCVFNYCKQKNYKIGAYIYDGCLIYKNTVDDIDEVCKELSEEVEKELNISIKFISKPFETCDLYLRENKDAYKRFNLQYCQSLMNFQEMKKYFETFFGHIKKNGIYYERSVNGSFTYTENQIISLLKGIKIYNKDKNKPIKFSDLYLSCNSRKIYDNVDLSPTGVDENRFNIYNPLIEPNVIKPAKYDKYIHVFKKLVGQIVGDYDNELGYVDYFLDWIADIIQNPTNKSNSVFIILRGPQGTGKSMMLNIISWILTKKKVLITNKLDDVFGHHNNLFLDKLLTCLEEVEADKTTQATIKHYTTSTTATINPKGLDQVEINNYSRFIFTSNKKIPVSIDSGGERRACVFESLTRLSRENLKQFGDMYMEGGPKHEEFKNAVIKFMFNRKIKIKSFQLQVPKNKAYREMITRTIDPRFAFFAEYIQKHKYEIQEDPDNPIPYYKLTKYTREINIKKTDIFEDYKEFLKENEIKYFKKKKDFFIDISNKFNIGESKSHGQRCIKFIPKQVLKKIDELNFLTEYEGHIYDNEPINYKIQESKLSEDEILDLF